VMGRRDMPNDKRLKLSAEPVLSQFEI
jgi:hypothetical protein